MAVIRVQRRWTVISVALAVVLGLWSVVVQQTDSKSGGRALPPQRTSAGFVTSHSCRSCHPGKHASWHQTFHRTMTQRATPETVVASFDDVQLSVDDQNARLTRQGNQFWVEMNDPAWERKLFAEWTRTRTTGEPDPFTSFRGKPPRVTAEVVMTTGSHHFQAY